MARHQLRNMLTERKGSEGKSGVEEAMNEGKKLKWSSKSRKTEASVRSQRHKKYHAGKHIPYFSLLFSYNKCTKTRNRNRAPC